MNHKNIKKFQVSVQFKDDSDMIRVRAQYENLLTQDMRNKGYLRVLDLDPNFSVEFDGETWVFLMTLYGVYVGKKKSWQSEGITQGKLIPRSMRQTISNL
jgi:hypothetical protein